MEKRKEESAALGQPATGKSERARMSGYVLIVFVCVCDEQVSGCVVIFLNRKSPERGKDFFLLSFNYKTVHIHLTQRIAAIWTTYLID